MKEKERETTQAVKTLLPSLPAYRLPEQILEPCAYAGEGPQVWADMGCSIRT